MIEMCKLNVQERKELIRGSECFKTMRSTKPQWLQPITKKLISEIGDVKFLPELRLILTAATKAKRYNLTASQFNMSPKGISHANELTGQKNSVKRLRLLLTIMEDLGYLTYMQGFRIAQGESCGSYLSFHETLLRKLSKRKCDKYGMKRDDVTLIEIVDIENTIIKRKINKKGNLVKKKTLVFKTTKNIKGSKVKRENLEKYNRVLEKVVVTYKGQVVRTVYKRRFEGDLFGCGRYYSIGGLQGEDKDFRYTIQIKGNPTVEADIKFTQPALLLTKAGIKMEEGYDPYDIGIVTREFTKSLLFPVLFSNSRKDAKTSITEKLKKEGLKDLTSEEVIQAFEKHNKDLMHYFYKKSQYRDLQYWESSIAEYVIDYFTSLNIAVLCYHDSLIIETQYKEELLRVMREGWIHVMGNDDNLYLEIKHES